MAKVSVPDCLPPWLNAEDLVDRVVCEELRQLTAQAEALEPQVRAMCIRAFHANRRYSAQVREVGSDMPEDALPLVLSGALASLASHLRGALESIAPEPEWRRS